MDCFEAGLGKVLLRKKNQGRISFREGRHNTKSPAMRALDARFQTQIRPGSHQHAGIGLPVRQIALTVTYTEHRMTWAVVKSRNLYTVLAVWALIQIVKSRKCDSE
jgi:hypothetical protein